MNDYLLIDEMFISSFLNYLDAHKSIHLTLLDYPSYEGQYYKVSGLSDSFIELITREASYMLADFGELKLNRKVFRFLLGGYKFSAVLLVKMYKGWSLRKSKEWVDEIQINCIPESPVIFEEIESFYMEYKNWLDKKEKKDYHS